MAAAGPIPDELSIDSSHIESASLGERLKKGEFEEAIGRSRGGRTSKIHALADDRGRPVAFALTPGNVADVVMAIPLLGAVAKPKRVLADKAYDADSLRRWLKQRKEVRAAIPCHRLQARPNRFDRAAYKRRNVIERLFCKLKNWRLRQQPDTTESRAETISPASLSPPSSSHGINRSEPNASNPIV